MKTTTFDKAHLEPWHQKKYKEYYIVYHGKGVGCVRYIVQPWETWESMDTIAARFGVTPEALVAANPILNGAPLGPGMMLTIPGRPEMDFPTEHISITSFSPVIPYTI